MKGVGPAQFFDTSSREAGHTLSIFLFSLLFMIMQACLPLAISGIIGIFAFQTLSPV